MGTIDDVIISNCFATKAEFEKVKSLPHDLVSFGVELVDAIPAVEKSIVFG